MMGPGGLKQVYRLLIMLDLRFFLDLYHFYMTESPDESSRWSSVSLPIRVLNIDQSLFL